jgi:ABC-type transport system substrate-binding protein
LRLTEYVEGSSVTWEKNPSYWGYDEKFPQNRLPYIDTYRSLLVPDLSTRLGALRTGKLDMMGTTGDANIYSIDDVESLQRTNPEINVWPFYGGPIGVVFNWALPPTDDVNVRKALQMAVDRETINNTYNKGYGDPTPYGLVGQFSPEYAWQYEDWPEEVKMGYMYDPAGAEALLDAAGYPRGADGVRFKVKLGWFDRYETTYPEILMGYFDAIGVESELEVLTIAEAGAAGSADTHEWHLFAGMYGGFGGPAFLQNIGRRNESKAKDPRMDALYNASLETLDIEEAKTISRQADEIFLRDHWGLNKSNVPRFFVSQPWVQGYFGEGDMAIGERNTFQARLWIDSELKQVMMGN